MRASEFYKIFTGKYRTLSSRIKNLHTVDVETAERDKRSKFFIMFISIL